MNIEQIFTSEKLETALFLDAGLSIHSSHYSHCCDVPMSEAEVEGRVCPCCGEFCDVVEEN